MGTIMFEILCKKCNTKLSSHGTQMKCCGCDNFTCIRGDTITAEDLSSVIILSGVDKKKPKRKPQPPVEPKRKITKQNFEVR